MSETTTVAPTRRVMLFITTGAFAAVGAGALAWPFISQMNPDASTVALAGDECAIYELETGWVTSCHRRKDILQLAVGIDHDHRAAGTIRVLHVVQIQGLVHTIHRKIGEE